MADRRSAALFAEIFNLIRRHVPKNKRREVAKIYWERAKEYDFDTSQMHCDATLLKLGLAKECINEFGDDDVVYLDEEGWEDE